MATKRGTSGSTRATKKAPPKRSTTASKSGARTPAKAAGNSKRSRRGADAVQSKTFKRATSEARKVLKDPKEAEKLGRKAQKKADEHSGALKDVLDDLQALIRMIRAYARGEYRDVPWVTIVSATAAVIYFVWPLDVIPDLIPVVGFSDDVLVALFVIGAIRADLDDFRNWEDGGGESRARTKPKPKRPGGSASKSTKKSRPSRGRKS